jgi:uncharacterized protein (TIGR04222 family)
MRVYPIWFYSALVAMALVQVMLTRVGSRHGVDDIDVWQVAFVAGGYRRVVDTALAGLAIRGQLQVSRRLTLTPGAVPDNPIESAVCLALNGATSRRAVLLRLRNDPAVLAVEAAARSRGLLLDGARALWWWLVMLPLLAIAGIGLARTQSLVTTLVLAAIVVAVLGLRLRVRHRPTPTGRAAVRRMVSVYETRPRPTGGMLAGVAALGFNAIEDDDLRWALKKAAGTARAGGD